MRQKIAPADAAIATGGQSLADLATQLGQQADAIAELSKRFAQQAAAQRARGPLVAQATRQATTNLDVARRNFTTRDLAVRDVETRAGLDRDDRDAIATRAGEIADVRGTLREAIALCKKIDGAGTTPRKP